MKKRSLVGWAVTAALALAACGGSDSSSDTSVPSDSTTPTAGAVDLSVDCPSTVAFQTDWNPESEHGFLYQMVGPGYTVDTAKLRVTGDLVTGGRKTGVKIEVRAGGPAIGYGQVTAELYKDPSLLLGFVSTDEAVSNSAEFPTMSVVATFNINPQIIMWDPATYPDVKKIADLKDKDVKVRYFDGAAYIDYFVESGILSKSQVDATYDGYPTAFVAAGGKDAQQGFGTSEPYYYENVLETWKKPVAYQYIHDAGWTAYAQSLGGTPENVQKYDACLKKLVPIIQQAQVDFVKSPETTNALILDLVNQYNNGWIYDAGQAEAAVTQMLADSLVKNSPDGTLGSFDMERVKDFISRATPVYTASGTKVKKNLKAEDIVTNKYIDPSISLG